MKNKIYLIFYVLTFLCNYSFAEDIYPNPLSILVIGGGPAGLATAIEAKMNGCAVTVLEKRENFSRSQSLLLLDPSLKLLEKWKVNIPQLRSADIGNGTLIGVVQIKHLEEQLENRARELGVKKIYGEFKNFKTDQQATIIMPDKNEITLSYDIIVGADGTHSKMREILDIETHHLGTGFGAVALIPSPVDASMEIDISPVIKSKEGFLRRMKIPKATIVFIQFPQTASKTDLEKAVESQGWSKEAKAMREDKALIAENIGVSLLQAKTFSNKKRSAILVGDAAASASFFQGMGANTALKTAEIAGRFFREVQEKDVKAFQNFNQAIKETTDGMIEDSAFLFASKN